MKLPGLRPALLLLTLPMLPAILPGAAPDSTALRFEVTVAKGLLPEARTGRVLVVLAKGRFREPRYSIGQLGRTAAPVLGVDGIDFQHGSKVVVDEKAILFPIARLADL